MRSPIATLNESLLAPSGLDLDRLQGLVGQLAVGSVDYGDLFFERAEAESWSLEDGEVKDASFHQDTGVGVRAVAGDRQGFAYTSELSATRISEAIDAAVRIQKDGDVRHAVALSAKSAPILYQPINPILEQASQQKIAFLKTLDAAARAADPRMAPWPPISVLWFD